MSVATTVLALAVVGTGFARPTLVENVTLGDLAILGLIAISAVNVVAGNGAVGDVAGRLALPAVLIAAGSLVASMSVGLHEWTVGDFVRDVAVAAAFLAAIDVVRREGDRSLRTASWALAATGVVVSMQLVVDGGIRAQATFPNPNVAGHFLATLFVALLVLPLPRGVRAVALGSLAVGLVRTSSFGGLLQVVLGLAYLAWSRLRRSSLGHHEQLAVVAGLALVAGVGAALLVPTVMPEENTASSGLSEARLEKSAEGRIATWGEGLELVTRYPLGVGAGSTRGLELLTHEQELHNEPLAYLVERGVIGLAGLVALAVALWRLAPRGGGSRALLLGFGVSSLVRETSHYRHLWLVLALVLVADAHRRSRRERADARA